MPDEKRDEQEQHSKVDHVIRVDVDAGPEAAPIVEDDAAAIHPAGHRFGGSIGAVPSTPNLSPGGSVQIKR